MTLSTFWFLVIALLWTGFLVLEGFDFGVGMLHGVIGRDETGRRLVVSTIGPVWDGNEVWLVVAGGGMFAAFPSWYATMFSGFYLVMLVLLVVLILRGLSFEFRGKRDSTRWRRSWDLALTGGSLAVPFIVGVALSDLLRGLPIGAGQEFVGNLLDLFSGYSVFGGITVVLICLLHGSAFLALKTTGDLRVRSIRSARLFAPVTAAAVIAFMIWTRIVSGRGFLPSIVEIAAMLAVLAAAALVLSDLDGWAFAATAVTMAAVVVSLFTDLYPRVMVSSLGSANDLTVNNTTSSPYALRVMTIAAGILLPLVIAYQAWSYYTFRRRISRKPVRGGDV